MIYDNNQTNMIYIQSALLYKPKYVPYHKSEYEVIQMTLRPLPIVPYCISLALPYLALQIINIQSIRFMHLIWTDKRKTKDLI